jgi:Spy/CpxP family protein refolding chaperone
MKTLKYVVLAVAIVLTAGGLFVFTSRAAQSTANDSLGGRWRERMKQKLNLTDGQLSQIKSQLKAEKDNITSILNRLHDARTELRAAIQKPDATEATVREAAAKVSVVESDLAVERLKLYGKISPILTADQKAELEQIEAGIDQIVDRVINRIDTKLSE